MRIVQCKLHWVLHALTIFEYAHLMEKARIIIVQYGINDAGQRDHIGREGQLVVLTSPLGPGTQSQNGRHNSPRHRGIPNKRTIRPEIWAFQMNGL